MIEKLKHNYSAKILKLGFGFGGRLSGEFFRDKISVASPRKINLFMEKA
jgi:hypothetical protein